MKEHEIVQAVKQSTDLSDQDEATTAVRATLRTLGTRLAGGEPSDLAAQLPPALAEAIPVAGPGERFGVDEFYERVGTEEGADPRRARQHARAVGSVLRTAVTDGELAHLLSQLPDEYSDLFGTGPVLHH